MLRELRVRRIEKKVRAGTYTIDSAKLADAILHYFRKQAQLTKKEWREFTSEDE